MSTPHTRIGSHGRKEWLVNGLVICRIHARAWRVSKPIPTDGRGEYLTTTHTLRAALAFAASNHAR